MVDNTKLICIKDLSFGYGEEKLFSCEHLDIVQGEFVAVVGANGVGKSTFMKLLLGLLPMQQGKIDFFGKSLQEFGHLIGYVPQSSGAQKEFPISVYDVVRQGFLGNKKPLATGIFAKKKQEKEAIEKVLKQIKLWHKKDANFGELSGGELRRCFLARALISQPQVLILDEPTAGLDHVVEQEIYQQLGHLKGEVTIIMVSHDLDFVSKYVDKVVCLDEEIHTHPVHTLTSDRLTQLFVHHYKEIKHQNHLRDSVHE